RRPARPTPAPPPRYAKVSTRRRAPRRALAAGVGGAIVVAAAIVVAIALTSSGSNPAASSNSSRGTARADHHAHSRTAVPTTASPPSDVPVAVLNSTSTPNLASTVMTKLAAGGYQKGAPPANAPDSPLTSTIVGYTKPAYRADALAVAKALNLGQTSVQGVSQGDLAAACGQSTTSCSVKVVVTVGSDLASGG
ncbi:MAG: LytR C-terminal domain-containing protein, partial [Solirubrobacteraceae bacterium]